VNVRSSQAAAASPGACRSCGALRAVARGLDIRHDVAPSDYASKRI